MATPSTFVADDTPASFQPDDAPSSFVADEAPTQTVSSGVTPFTGEQMEAMTTRAIAENEWRKAYGAGQEPGTELTNALFNQFPQDIANIARAVPADVASSMRALKTGELDAGGNVLAAFKGEPLPIDAALSEASQESPGAATVAKISQGLAGTAPLLIGMAGLPAGLSKVAVGAFTAHMMSAAPHVATELGTEFGKPESERDLDKITSLVSEGAQIVAFSALGGAHLGKAGGQAWNKYASERGLPQIPESLMTERRPVADMLSEIGYGVRTAQRMTPEGEALREANAPATAAVMEESTKPLNPGGSREALSPELKTIEADSAAKQRQIAEEFKKSLEQKPVEEPYDPYKVAEEHNLKVAEAKSTPVGESVSDILRRYDEGDSQISTPRDVADAVQSLIDSGKAPKSLQTHIDKLQREIKEAREFGVRMDMEGEAADAMMSAFENHAKKEAKALTQQSPSTPEVVPPKTAAAENAPAAANVGGKVVANEKAISTVAEKEGVGEATTTVQGLGVERVQKALQEFSKEPNPVFDQYEFQKNYEKTNPLPKRPRARWKGGPMASADQMKGVETNWKNKMAAWNEKFDNVWLKHVRSELSKGEPMEEYQMRSLAMEFMRKGLQSEAESLMTKFGYAKDSFTGKWDKKTPTQPGLTPEELTTSGAAPGSPLTPLPTAATPLPPKSQRQIITDLSKGLGVPIRFGRLTSNKFAGYFKSVANLIGSRKANDIPVVAHEVGHALDKRMNLSRDPAISAELNVLGDPATPGSRSSWTKSRTIGYKHAEGLSEFVRFWLTDDAAAKAKAPNTYATFETALNANKDFGDVLRQAKDDIRVWREAEPQARLRSHISVGENPNKTPYTLSQLTRDLVDDLHIMRLAVEEAKKTTDLKPSKDPYLLARNLRGSYGMAETFVRNGVVDFKTKEVKLGTSFEDALKPVAGRMSDFRDWIVAKRAQELMAQGRETGLVPSDVTATAAKFDADPAFQEAFTKVKEWNDSLLQYAEDAGLVSADGAAAIRAMNSDYVPFHRLFEVGAGEAPSQSAMGVGTGLNAGKPGSLKRLEGSTRTIVDPLETMVKNAYAIITASEKAAINKAVAEMADLPNMGQWVERIASPQKKVEVDVGTLRDQLEAAGADLTRVPDDVLLNFFRPNRSTPFGENVIKVIKDGEPQYYRLNKDLHDTFQALDLEDSGKLVRMLSAPSQLLRAGVVLEPSFNVANALRDTFSSAVIGKYGALPFETTLRGVAAMLKNPQVVAEWAASGGKSAVEANFFDRTKMQNYLAEKIAKDLTPTEQALVILKSPITALRYMTSVFEETTRIGEYKIAYDQLRKGGMPEGEARRLAAFEARDRQDFAKGGAKMKIVRHMAAFWNAQLQGNIKLAQAFKQRPVKTILQGLAFVTIPKLIEQAVNWDDQDYWNRPQWERDAFFLIPIGKDSSGHTSFLRIPTPFEVGLIFGTLPGRILQWAKENRAEAMKTFPMYALKQSVPNPIPQMIQTVFETFLSGKQGWDTFRGRPIVPDKLADLPPALQYTEQTSITAKKVGELLGLSPMKIDHIIERTTGGLGKIASGKQVPGQRFVTAPLAVSNQPTDDFYTILSELKGKQAAKKLTNESGSVNMLTEFERDARLMSDLRARERKTTDPDRKAEIQNRIFEIAKRRVQQYRDAQSK